MKSLYTHIAAYFAGGVITCVILVCLFQEKLTNANHEVEALRRINDTVYSSGFRDGLDVDRDIERRRARMNKEDDAILIQQLQLAIQDLQNRVDKLEDAKLPPPPK